MWGFENVGALFRCRGLIHQAHLQREMKENVIARNEAMRQSRCRGLIQMQRLDSDVGT